MSDAYEDLVATVADLKERIEALERRLAGDRLAAGTRSPESLEAKWDNAEGQEHRWSERDFVA
jgi:cell division septum initiation protein DivIVA